MTGRPSHLTPEERRSADELLRRAPFAFVAMVEESGPYVVPMNFAYAPGRLYLHTGPGRKSAALAADPRVCVAVTMDEAYEQGASPCKDGYSFKGVIAEGWAKLLEEHTERQAALQAIVAKYDPAAAGEPLEEAAVTKTLVYAVIIDTLTYRELPPRAA